MSFDRCFAIETRETGLAIALNHLRLNGSVVFSLAARAVVITGIAIPTSFFETVVAPMYFQ